MHQYSIFFTVLIFIFLSVLGTPLPLDQSLEKRQDIGQARTGQATWFYDGLGACGEWNNNNDTIVALSAQIYQKSLCNQLVKITNTATQQISYGTIRDECQSCQPGDLDMSMGLFQIFAPLSDGVFPIEWELVSST